MQVLIVKRHRWFRSFGCLIKNLALLAAVLFVVQQRDVLTAGVVGLIVTYTWRVRDVMAVASQGPLRRYLLPPAPVKLVVF